MTGTTIVPAPEPGAEPAPIEAAPVSALPRSPQEFWEIYGHDLLASALNVVSAAAILIFGLWIAGWAGDAMRKFSRQHPRIDDTLAAFFSWLVRYALIGFVIVAVLNRFGVATTSIVAVLGASALAIGLALQGTLSNLAAGVMLMLFRPYRLGDTVELHGRLGVVEDVTLFTTEITTPQNIKIVLPNGLCWGAPMVNYTAHPRRRIDLEFSVAYESDLERAMEAILAAAKGEHRVLLEPGAHVDVVKLGDFAVTLQLRVWAKSSDFLAAKFALIKAGKEALDKARIVIPYPTTTTYQFTPNGEGAGEA
jgi:small conductance mechanosensitive channel